MGGTLIGIYKEPPIYEITISQTTFSANYDKNNHFYAGTIVLGVGISAVIAGAIFAGIGGYRYIRMKPASDDFDVSFSMSFNKASLQFKF